MNRLKEKIRFPRTPTPYEDESGWGWLLRCSEENGIHLSWLLGKVYDHFLTTATIQIHHFADFFAKDPNALLRFNYCSNIRDTYAFRGSVIPRMRLLESNVQICSLCVQENGYIDALWDLSNVVACDKHHIFLTYRCTSCGKCLTWKRPGLLTCRCGAPIQSQLDYLDDSVVKLHAALRSIALSKPDITVQDHLLYGYDLSTALKTIDRLSELPLQRSLALSRTNMQDLMVRASKIIHSISSKKSQAVPIKVRSNQQAAKSIGLPVPYMKLLINQRRLRRSRRNRYSLGIGDDETSRFVQEANSKLLDHTGEPTIPLASILAKCTETSHRILCALLDGEIRAYRTSRPWPHVILNLEDVTTFTNSENSDSGFDMPAEVACRLLSVVPSILQKLVDLGVIEAAAPNPETNLSAFVTKESVLRLREQYQKFYSVSAFFSKYFVSAEIRSYEVSRHWFVHRDDLRTALTNVPEWNRFSVQYKRLCIQCGLTDLIPNYRPYELIGELIRITT